jgi:hypothetical protein
MFERIRRNGKRAALVIGAACMLALAGCSGEGAGALGGSGSGSASTGGASDGTVQLVGSTTTINSDGKTMVELTAIVTSKTNVAMPKIPIVFGAVDKDGAPGGVRLEVLRTTTDETGTATATLKLQGDPSSRDIVVTATANGVASPPLTVRVTGTTLGVTGPKALALNMSSPTGYTVSLRDSAGSPLAGRAVTATSEKGNTLSAATVTTDSSGQAIVNIRGTVAGADVLRFASLGETTTYAISVAGEGLSATSGAGFQTIDGLPAVPIATTANIQVAYQAASGIPAGTLVEMSTTRGTVSPASASIVGGTATFTVTSSFAGPATVTARVAGVSAEFAFSFVSTTASQIDLQPSPAVVGPNLGTSTEQRSTLTTVVRDPAGNPVANRSVTFTALDDPSGGSISPGVATTDLAGRATAAFIAGPNTTAPNAVRVQASVDGIPSQVALLSVARSQLFVRMGTDNTVEKIEPSLYRKTYAVIVTDATGNAVPDANVQLTLRPLRYATGTWNNTGGTPPWEQVITDIFQSEDRDRNGVCNAGEDTNRDGQLTPGNVASVIASAVTAANGVADVKFQYPREFANWVEVLLEARIQVGGSEGAANSQFWLPIEPGDVSNPTVAPPGTPSPLPFASGDDIVRTCPPP